MTKHYGKAEVLSSLRHFLFGKALNAIVSVTTLVVLARWLSTEDYGSYITLIALQATLLAVSNLGIEATTERFLPEFRTRYADEQLLGFVVTGFGVRLLTLFLIAGIGFMAAEPLASWVGLPLLDGVLRIWLFAMVGYGALNYACVLLEAMLKQKHAQYSMSTFLAIKLVFIAGLNLNGNLQLKMLVICEVVAGIGAAIFSVFLLGRQFHRAGMRSGWRLVLDNQGRLGRFAGFNYIAQCVFQFFSTDMLKMLVGRLAGVTAAASYGFAANLADMVQRYLPATLLQRLIKPVFVSRYVRSGNFEDLNQMARVILKLNLLILIPAIAVACVYGSELLDVVTKGKYGDSHWLFVGALVLLIPSSHQAILSLLAGTLEKNGMQFYAGMISAIGFPIALVLIPALGPIGAVAAATVSAFLYNTVATIYLRRAGFEYQPDWRSLAVFAFSGGSLVVCLMLSKAWMDSGVLRLTALAILCAGYLFMVRRFSAFSNEERSMLNAILPKPLFVF